MPKKEEAAAWVSRGYRSSSVGMTLGDCDARSIHPIKLQIALEIP